MLTINVLTASCRTYDDPSICMVAESEIPAFKIGRALKGRPRGRPPLSIDTILEMFFYRLRVSGPWRDLDSCFGPWRTAYGWYAKFEALGIWSKALKIIAKQAKGKTRFIDGTHIRVHQSGANPAGGQAAQAMGKTKGGRNTKLMILVDVRGKPVALWLIPGQAYEGHHVVPLVERADLTKGMTIVGDKGFDDDKLRAALTALGFKTCFATKSNRKSARPMHKGLYRKRFRVENCFCRLKRWAGIATRRDKLAARFLSLATFAAVLEWLT